MMVRIDRFKLVLKSLPRRETKREKFTLGFFVFEDSCGTAACACGWYKLKHPRVKLGFVSQDRQSSFVDPADVAKHFRITYEQAKYLFWHRNRDPRHNSLTGTRARIRQFIDDHKREARGA